MDLISRAAAIEAIKRAIWDKHTAKDAIDAVCNVPSEQPVDKDINVPTNDLISRQAEIKAIEDLPNCYNGYSDTYDKACIIGLLEELPSAERKNGRWIRHYCEDGNPDGWQCDQCAEWYYFGETKPNFCPNCGADMRGEEYG